MRARKKRAALPVTFVAASMFCLLDAGRCLPQASTPFRGIAYTSYQEGEYSVTTSWKPQDWIESQGITAVSISTERSFEGEGALKADFMLLAGDPNISQGETLVDLRYKPPLFEAPDCSYAPFDLFQQNVTVKIYVTEELSNEDTEHPNGLQLFFKSIDESEAWWSFYGEWHNIDPADVGAWKTVSATPSTSPPPGGGMDPLFDPHRIVSVGVKLGTGSGSDFAGVGSFWIDNVDWPAGIEPEYGFENVLDSVESAAVDQVTHASVLVTWYMDDATSSEIHPVAGLTHSDAEVLELIDYFHALGIEVLLKPHVDVLDGTWRGWIQPADVDSWFAQYTEFITHYAQMAGNRMVRLFCVGTELESLSGSDFQSSWLAVIAAVEALYLGDLTYAANWDGYAQARAMERSGRLDDLSSRVDLAAVGRGFASVSFWDSLDYAGIDAYFPLSDEADPSLGALIAGWTSYEDMSGSRNWLQEIGDFYESVAIPVLFTEIGYSSRDYAAREPWQQGDPAMGDVPNAALQARAYEAAFRALEGRPWFEGFFWWNWLPWSDAGGSCDMGFTPQNKPAEQILREGFSGTLFIFTDGFESGDTGSWFSTTTP